jgi:eukaryotic-like serine/threonine-protein kinase
MSIEPGRKFGTYEIVGPLGAGGMGEVYQARDSRLKRDVAIKVLSAKLSNNAEHGSRFKSEALMLASLNHPNIASIYGLEEFSGQQLLVMELVEGETLAELLLSRGSIPAAEALALCRQVAEALEAAHLKRITHRDVKPSNVKVTPEGRIKVLDFGLGKALRNTNGEQNLSQLTTVTALSDPSGVIVGTPSYMSPEQARGRPVDQRTDIWSFGCLLFELLTGKRAFRGETTPDTIAAILEREPDWQALPPATPVSIRELLGKCLQKNADLRLPSMREVIEEIEKARSEGGGWTIRRRKAIAAVAALAIIPMALLSWPVIDRQWRALMLPKQKNVIVIPFRSIAGDARQQTFADGLTETVTTALNKHGELSVVPATEARRVESALQARREFGVNLVVSGTLERRGDAVRLTLSLTDAVRNRQIDAEPIDWPASRPWEVQDAVVPKLAELLNLVLTDEARDLPGTPSAVPAAQEAYVRGRGFLYRSDLPENVERAIQEFTDATRLDPAFALAYVGIAEAQLRTFRVRKEPQILERAARSAERAQTLNPNLATTHLVLGGIKNDLRQYEDAIRELETARKMDPRDPAPNRELGTLFDRLGRNEEAATVYAKAIAQRPGDWLTFRSAAGFYATAQRFDLAERYFRKVIDLTPDNHEGYRNLGGVLLKLGRQEEAEEMLLRAQSLYPTARALTNLGWLYMQPNQLRYKDAVRVMEQAAALAPRQVPNDYIVWGNLGDAYWLAKGDMNKARQAWQHAAEIVRKQLMRAPADGDLLSYLAKFEAKAGESTAALEHIKAALSAAPQRATVRFQASVVYALLGDKDLAIDQVESAIKLKYSKEEIQQAPELESLQGVPRFGQVLANPPG